MTLAKYQTRSRDNLFLRPSTVGVLARLSFADRRPPFVTNCHGCGAELLIEMIPANIFGIRKIFYPCQQAPYICSGCRMDWQKLHDARRAMVEHFHNCGRTDHETETLVSKTIPVEQQESDWIGA